MIRTYILNKSYFISFEGIDGSGKSTQAKLLIERLNSNSIETCFVREPGGTKISEEIRNILLDDRAEEMSSRTEALLMCASRAQLTKNIIMPELPEIEIVKRSLFQKVNKAKIIDVKIRRIFTT